MPHMNGFEFVRKIREISPSVKIVLMTAFEIKKEELTSALPSISIDGLIQKPISMQKLVGLVTEHL
jgi:two-component SAPR family response regulator